MKQFFLIFVLFSAVFAFKTHNPVLGPNIEYGVFGAAAPADLRGAFVPQFNTSFDFAWLEPLGASSYGSFEPNKTRYIKFLAGAELSPFYGTVRAGIGFAPLPPPFSILELRLVYENENLFWSDVEMAMRPEDDIPINETWNAGYIFDSFYNRSSYSQIQSFNTQLGGTYLGRKFNVSFFFHFALIDITSDYNKKSFDYMRGIPLFSRDYVTKLDFDIAYLYSQNFVWNLNTFRVLSGRQPGASFNTYDKEPLQYYVITTGPSLIFNNGKSHFNLSSGFFNRNSADKTFDNSFGDSFAERILLFVEYKHFWNFKFGKE